MRRPPAMFGGPDEPFNHTAGVADTSEYLYGRVAVTAFFVESNGSAEVQTENWTAPELSLAQTEIADALAWWAAAEPAANLTFDLTFEFYNVSIEPINHVCGWDGGGTFTCEDTLWVGDVMAQKGYAGPVSARARAYLNDLRAARGTPWAFALFVIDSEADADGMFISPGGTSAFAYSYFGGPYLFMTSDNGPNGPSAMGNVTAHEFGHIFYATDEYNGASELSGYFAAGDNEGSGCLMETGLPTCLSPGTREQIGWRDTDTDGLLDVVDVFPDTVLSISPPPLNPGINLSFAGTTTIAALPNLNPQDPGADIQLAHVANVSYRVDGGSWVLLPAGDGGFDSDVESFAFNLTLLSGPHAVEVCGTSDVGNLEVSCAVHLFTVDTTLPDSAVIPPVPTLWNTSVIPIVVTASDDVNVSSVDLWFRKDAAGNYSLHANDAVWPYAFTFDATSTGDGFYEFYSIATDDAGNVEPAPGLPDANVTVDTTPPATALDPPGVTSWYLLDFQENFNVAGGPATTYFRVDGGTWLTGVSVTFTTEGTHSLDFYSVDTAGNVETVRNATFRLDKTDPVSTLAPLVNLTNDRLITLNWSASDTPSGVDRVEIYFRPAGPFLWQFHGTDDVSPYLFTAPSNGSYEFAVLAQDVAGRREAAPSAAQAWTTIDTRPPGAAPNALPFFTTSPRFNVTVLTDEDIAIATVELWVSFNGGNFTLLNSSTLANVTFDVDTPFLGGQGTYEFYAIAEDQAGNRQPVPIAGIETTVDHTPPVVIIDTPVPSPTWILTTSPLLSWTMNDAVSGIGSVQVRVDSGLWIDVGTATFHTLSLPGDGTYTVSVRATDRAGNVLNPPTMRTIRVDATAPAFTIVEPVANATSANGTMVVQWIITETASGVASVRLRLNNEDEFPVTGGNWTFTNLTPGPYSLLITATDASGQIGQTTVTWLVTGAGDPDPNASPFNIWAWVLLIVIVVFLVAILMLMMGRKKAKPFEELGHMQPVGAEVDTGHGLAETPEAPMAQPRPRQPKKKAPPRPAPEPQPEPEEAEEPTAQEPAEPVERARRDDVL